MPEEANETQTEENVDVVTETDNVKDVKLEDILPEEFKKKGYMEKVNSVDDLFKTLDDAQKIIGTKTIPNEKSSDEEWTNFYTRIGRPNSSEDYKIEAKIAGQEISPALEGAFRDKFFKAGLNQKQVDTIMEGYTSAIDEKIELRDHKEKLHLGEELMKLFPGKPSVALGHAKELVKSYVSKNAQTHLNKLGVEGTLIMVDILNNVKKLHLTSDEVLPKGGTGGAPSGVDAKIAAIRKNKDYLKGRGAKFDKLDAELTQLYMKKYG